MVDLTIWYLFLSFSLFVLLKGASKAQAFDIGKDIVDTVTATNPKPVKLKFEKVWLCEICNFRKSRKFCYFLTQIGIGVN